MREIWKQRRIRIETPRGEDWKASLRDSLSPLPGVRRCRVGEPGIVEVEYNLLVVRFEAITDLLTSKGFCLWQGLWERIKRGFIRYIEQNELDNLTAPERPCCSDPKLDR